MKTTIILSVAFAALMNCADAQEPSPNGEPKEIPFELSDTDKQIIKMRIKLVLEKDQQFRSYMSFGTTDESKIARLKKLGMKEQMQAMAEKSQLSPEVLALLRQLQKKNDTQNHQEFCRIVRQYGYPSSKRLGTKSDRLFVLLLHPPVELENIETHIQEMSKLLLPEVKSGRMPAKLFATFIDNMHGKILRKPQVYGTNQQFDRATGKVLPPQIEDLKKTNAARVAIGLPELKAGEYRLIQKAR